MQSLHFAAAILSSLLSHFHGAPPVAPEPMIAASQIPEAGNKLAPMGYIVFCVHHPDACRPAGRPGGSSELTPASFRELQAVNLSVNRNIQPRHDVGIGYAADQWDLEPKAGDCEDYALSKRERLIEKGWNPADLRLATSSTPTGEGHAVLVVKTDRGDLVLDNRNNEIRGWDRTDLFFISIQSAENPKFWHLVRQTGPILASARLIPDKRAKRVN